MQVLKREAEVIANLERQPLWFKIFKVVLIVATFLFFTILFHIVAAVLWLGALVICGAVTHFIYRWKTEGWTKSWGRWIHDSEDIRSAEKLFYVLGLGSWVVTVILSLVMFSVFRMIGF